MPGAATNQPPTAATAPVTGASAPLQGAQGAGAAGSNRRESETNYAVDKTVRVTRGATGTVRRLHAAVVVNHRSNTDAKGKTTSTPLTDAELEKLTALVQQGIGFSKERGDSVRVVNAPFRVEAQPPAEAVPIYQQPWVQDLLRVGAVPLAMAGPGGPDHGVRAHSPGHARRGGAAGAGQGRAAGRHGRRRREAWCPSWPTPTPRSWRWKSRR